MNSYKEISNINFPQPENLWINMMPIIFGDDNSIPSFVKQYKKLIDRCDFRKGSTVYLSVRESSVNVGEYQSRPGLHTEAINYAGWGNGWGGGWGGNKIKEGIYMASTDGQCKIFDYQTIDVNHMGSCSEDSNKSSIITKPNTLYWLTDRTPHEVLPSAKNQIRQWFRLVSEKVDIWFKEHSTLNPLGIQPNCKIETRNKFER